MFCYKIYLSFFVTGKKIKCQSCVYYFMPRLRSILFTTHFFTKYFLSLFIFLTQQNTQRSRPLRVRRTAKRQRQPRQRRSSRSRASCPPRLPPSVRTSDGDKEWGKAVLGTDKPHCSSYSFALSFAGSGVDCRLSVVTADQPFASGFCSLPRQRRHTSPPVLFAFCLFWLPDTDVQAISDWPIVSTTS